MTLCPRANAARNLAEIAALTVCMGSRQLYLYDVTKRFGNDSPGYLWFRSTSNLRMREANQRVWPVDERLWLYDRRWGHLVAFDTAFRDGGAGADCINLSVFLDSMATGINLGFGECSGVDMLEGGLRDLRGGPAYTCISSLCGTPFAGTIAGTELGQSFANAAVSVRTKFALSRAIGGNMTPFGIDVNEARSQLCNAGGLGGGSDHNLCGASAGGMGIGNATMACLLKLRPTFTSAFQ